MYTITPEQLTSVTDVERAFGTTRLLPGWEEIPENFKRGNEYTRFASDLFFGNALPDFSMRFLDGFEESAEPLNRAVRAHLRSWAPKHEHKIAGVGYLMSKVFSIEPAK